MKVIVTCGPSFEPIDEVRRLTNFSTGELGVLLSESLAKSGCEVICLKGSGATFPGPSPSERLRVSSFDTNDDLLRRLTEFSKEHDIEAVFHAAALCDYKIDSVSDAEGGSVRSAKIASRSGAITLRLVPATKVLSQMRTLFPKSTIVGWKYELAGTPAEVLAKAKRQLQECRTNACIVNGRAWGKGFGFYFDDKVQLIEDKPKLAEFLPAWLMSRA